LSKIDGLTERIRFERATLVSDGGGGTTKTWASLYTCSAKLTPFVGTRAGKEQAVAGQEQASRLYTITVRRCSESAAIKEADRVYWRGQPMQIRAIVNEGPRPLFIDFLCEIGVNT